MYYVYQYLRTDLTPYYIGKGKNNRLSVKHRCKKPIDKNLIQIVANSLTESEAHLLERKLIAHYGRKDLCTGILRNLTSGGEGTSGYTHKEATKKKISKSLQGRPGSNHKGNLGYTHTKEAIAKISQASKTRVYSKETCEKHSKAMKGKNTAPKSEEHKRKIAEACRKAYYANKKA
jgi:hypothetical protein